MTGRRLYDVACDEMERQTGLWARGLAGYQLPATPMAWPFLTAGERAVWNATAKRLPKRGAA